MYYTNPVTDFQGRYPYLRSCVPLVPTDPEVGAEVARISPNFSEIYREAHKAEQYGLKLIAGAGYRKSLEFLIKDYLIHLKPDDTEDIKKKTLAGCIRDRVEDHRIKTTATRATWLGNDEVHYERKWEDKDLKDLKGLIKLTLHWVEAEEFTKKLEKDMPDPQKN
jgi:hypothetical protein